MTRPLGTKANVKVFANDKETERFVSLKLLHSNKILLHLISERGKK